MVLGHSGSARGVSGWVLGLFWGFLGRFWGCFGALTHAVDGSEAAVSDLAQVPVEALGVLGQEQLRPGAAGAGHGGGGA